MTKQKENHLLARTILSEKLSELGGQAFARWLVEIKGGEDKKTADANDFMMGLINGKFEVEKDSYLEPYLTPMREIVKALNVLKGSE